MKRYTKSQQIEDLIIALNEMRERKGLQKVARFWTGLGHKLHTVEENSSNTKWIGTHFNDDGFIGFLNGLLIEQ